MINFFKTFSILLSFAKARPKTKVNFIARVGRNSFLILFFLSYFFSAWNKMTSTGIHRKKKKELHSKRGTELTKSI